MFHSGLTTESGPLWLASFLGWLSETNHEGPLWLSTLRMWQSVAIPHHDLGLNAAYCIADLMTTYCRCDAAIESPRVF